MWFSVFCECFAICLLLNSCLHAQSFITYWRLMKTFLPCFWPQHFMMCFKPPPPSNSCCAFWLAAVPREVAPGSDTPAGVATGGRLLIPSSATDTPHQCSCWPWDELSTPHESEREMRVPIRGEKVLMEAHSSSTVSLNVVQWPFDSCIECHIFILSSQISNRPKSINKIHLNAPLSFCLNL